eukprot:m.201622 g.201622  ORF g.201622 m.201622 type:complete len:60 (-) comp15348_c0_seq2:410-589(-)
MPMCLFIANSLTSHAIVLTIAIVAFSLTFIQYFDIFALLILASLAAPVSTVGQRNCALF